MPSIRYFQHTSQIPLMVLAFVLDHCELHSALPVTPSINGSYFDVRLTINPTNLAYTANALELHTDLPNEKQQPVFSSCECTDVESVLRARITGMFGLNFTVRLLLFFLTLNGLKLRFCKPCALHPTYRPKLITHSPNCDFVHITTTLRNTSNV